MHDRTMFLGLIRLRRAARRAFSLLALLACAISASASCSSAPKAGYMTRDQLLDPETCKACHADHFQDWSGSMHAYAADDPVFQAMNARGQRETGGQLGKFCIQCHAPMAVREGVSTDGLNLATVPQKLKGVTCFFCHTADHADGSEDDNPVHLANDIVMRGGFADPVANTAHPAAYSALHDRFQPDSVRLCGTCHDIVNGNNVAIERTFAEWKSSVFSHAPGGDSCGQCHMSESNALVPIAQYPGVFARRYHGHDFPGVDVALTAFPQQDTQKQSIQDFLDRPTLLSELCVGQGTAGIHVALENAGAGHSWPSGAAQDRRAWVEVIAYSAGQVIYKSGVVLDGTAVTTTGTDDPDLWLLRDCMLDASDNPVPMFWQAAQPSESYLILGQATNNLLDPAIYANHVYQTYPRSAFLKMAPDRVTMRVRVQPIGLDVIDDLIASKDLPADTPLRAAIPTFDVGPSALVEWTAAKAQMIYSYGGVPFTCVSNTDFNPQSCLPGEQGPTCSLAPAHTHCKP